jgi:hypothetical protein
VARSAFRRAGRHAHAPAGPGPDHTGPDFTAPDFTAPDHSASDHTASGHAGPGHTGPGAGPGRPRRRGRWRRRGRIRRLLRYRTVRAGLALAGVVCCWAAFSAGQALTAAGRGSVSATLAEWARDHYLGPVVTLGEWLTYSPPQVGGTPGFSLTGPASDGPASATPSADAPHGRSGQLSGPARLTSPAGSSLPGEGAWRVLETVQGRPAVFGTYLRPDRVHTSYVAGIVSLDQRLVRFQLHPGAQDPGPGNWNALPWIPPGRRTGLLATFNGGFKLNAAGGGFYLNGTTRGTLTRGAASVVYDRDGTIRIGAWGSGVAMTPAVAGVRQNLRLIVDQGRVPSSVGQDVISSWGATLGGGYYVWRSGLGITRDGRVIFVYGPALDVRALAGLLQRAGAVEAMQLDINPYWMSFEYYQPASRPAGLRPVNLLPTQQQSAYRYFSVYSRDFTAVYAR